ncbi:Calx-beta domain-containing protein [Actinoplanes sp. NPDC049668]|uniref:Calx-beta domain-containing protein n=1 Tax=unclassified Actinoplanes TaxID=2626549 RepID=UPI0033A7AA9E
MRYQPAHAARSGSDPFSLRGLKPLRTALSAAVAGVIAFAPAVLIASPASAAPPELTIADAQAVEGSPVVFTLHYTGTGAATYNITVAPGTTNPAALTDFGSPSPASVTFAATGAPDQTVSVPTTDDALAELNETFKLTATNPADALDTLTAVGTILDNDPLPSYTLSAAPNPVVEGAGATATITAKLSALSGMPTVVTLNTVNGTAIAGVAPLGDYTAQVNEQFTIPAGQLTATHPIPITNDGVKDANDLETFTVNTVATNVFPTTASTTVSISDVQATPVLTLGGGGTVVEGTPLNLPITITPPSEKAITVEWNAVAAPAVAGHGAATPGTDFTYPASRTITIPAKTGTVADAITISAPVDAINELPEDIAIELVNPTNATLGSPVKQILTITGGESPPTVAITPTAVTEGNSGITSKTFTATLSAAAGRVVTVDWETASLGTAVGDAQPVKDYITKSGRLVFPAGTTTQTFTVDIVGDTIDEGGSIASPDTDTELFNIMLLNVDGSATIGSGITTIAITDDDAKPTFTFADMTRDEGDETAAVLLPLTLSGGSDQTLVFNITDVTGANSGTASGTVGALVGSGDYSLVTNKITVQPETTTGYGVLLVFGDDIYEGDETAYFQAAADPVTHSNDFITAPTSKTMKLTLVNDDKAPDLEINSVTVEEGETVQVTGTVRGISATNTYLNVGFAGGSSNGSKAADANDFVNPGVTPLTIDAGTTPGTVIDVAKVEIKENDTAEPAETIIVTGQGLGNVGTVTEGIITIAAHGGGGEEPGELTLKSSTGTRLGAGSVTLSGTASAEDAEVTLWGRTVSSEESDFAELKSTTAGAGGSFSFTQALNLDGMYFKVSEGDSESTPVRVLVKENPGLSATSPKKASVQVVVTGNPKVRGLSAKIFRLDGTKWVTAGTGILNASGTFTKSFTAKSGKTYSFRAQVVGNASRGILTSAVTATKSVKAK